MGRIHHVADRGLKRGGKKGGRRENRGMRHLFPRMGRSTRVTKGGRRKKKKKKRGGLSLDRRPRSLLFAVCFARKKKKKRGEKRTILSFPVCSPPRLGRVTWGGGQKERGKKGKTCRPSMSSYCPAAPLVSIRERNRRERVYAPEPCTLVPTMGEKKFRGEGEEGGGSSFPTFFPRHGRPGTVGRGGEKGGGEPRLVCLWLLSLSVRVL